MLVGNQTKWGDDDRCPWYGYGPANIDAKLNAAYILIGLLYGEGDFIDSMVIAMQCGQDSDCNPSSVGGILGTYYGFDGIPASCVRNLDEDGTRFSATTLSFRQTVDACYKLMNDSLSEYAVAEEDGYRIAVREIAARALRAVAGYARGGISSGRPCGRERCAPYERGGQIRRPQHPSGYGRRCGVLRCLKFLQIRKGGPVYHRVDRDEQQRRRF